MRDLEENEIVAVSGGECEPKVECKVTCTVARPPVCTAQCTVSVVCS
jgi:hypothetical protein